MQTSANPADREALGRMLEQAIARWTCAGITYGVAGLAPPDGPLVIVIAAVDLDGYQRTTHQVRPNDARELANQMVKWNAASDPERTREAEWLLAGVRPQREAL